MVRAEGIEPTTFGLRHTSTFVAAFAFVRWTGSSPSAWPVRCIVYSLYTHPFGLARDRHHLYVLRVPRFSDVFTWRFLPRAPI